MKNLFLIFIFFSNSILSQESLTVNLNRYLNLPENSKIHVFLDNIGAGYQLIGQEEILLTEEKKMTHIIFCDGPKIDTLISSEIYFIDSENICKVTIGKFGGSVTEKQSSVAYDTLFVKLTAGYPDYSVTLFSPDHAQGVLDWIEPGFGFTLLEHGTYDIKAQIDEFYYLRIIFQEDYVFSGPDTLYFNVTDAEHEINLRPVDIHGETLPLDAYLYDKFSILYRTPNGYRSSLSVSAPTNFNVHYLFSSGSDKFEVDFTSIYCDYTGENDFYLVDHETFDDGIDQDYILSNNAENYFSTHVNIDLPQHETDHLQYSFGPEKRLKFINYNGDYRTGGPGLIVTKLIPNLEKWIGRIYIDQFGNPEYKNCPFGIFAAGPGHQDHERVMYTYVYDKSEDSISNFITFEPYADVVNVSSNDTLFAGHGTSTPWVRWKNYYSELYFDCDWSGYTKEYYFPFYNSQKFEIMNEEGEILTAGTGTNYYSVVDPGIYNVRLINSHNEFANFIGNSEATFHFNTTLQDCRPPIIRPIQLRDKKSVVKYYFNTGEQVFLYFSAADFNYYSSIFIGENFKSVNAKLTEVRIKEHQQLEWIDVVVGDIYQDSLIGNLFKADLTEHILDDSALYDVQIKVVDSSENSAIYTFLPAFVVADFPVSVENKNEQFSINVNVTPNPAFNQVIVSSKETFQKVEIIDLQGKMVYDGVFNNKKTTIPINYLEQGVYFIRVYVSDQAETVKLIVSR